MAGLKPPPGHRAGFFVSPKLAMVMTEAQRAAKQAQLADLRRKHAKRKDEPGFAANVAELEQRIAQLEAELAG